ncbi:efflux RND transporter periplasmic adaptor subunit [candidate division KSB1 bacterium]|nr:efflux RND transporter periplasmic adaptor subunit [candidate division KSB1 bacterium]
MKMLKNMFGLVLFALLISSCSKQKGGGGFSMPPTPVEVAPAEIKTVVDNFKAVGTIDAVEAITVVGEIDATVISLPFKEGQEIRRGDLIAQLDDSQLAAEVARAEALRDQSKASYERIKSVVDQGAGAPQDLDDAAASLKVAEANLTLAKARFAKTRVVAPFDGTIGARKVSIGTFLRSGQAIAEMANIDKIRVNFSTPERFLPLMKPGAEVTVSTTAYPGYELKGKVIVVDPVLDAATRSVKIIAHVDNPGRKFRSGMSANISAVLSARQNAITIPNEAVFANGDQSFVYVVKNDSTVARAALTLGTRTSDYVEVVDGLAPDAKVVRAGYQKLYDGAKVIAMSVPAN